MSNLSAPPCFLGLFWMLWDRRKQTWHDRAANSLVVRASIYPPGEFGRPARLAAGTRPAFRSRRKADNDPWGLPWGGPVIPLVIPPGVTRQARNALAGRPPLT